MQLPVVQPSSHNIRQIRRRCLQGVLIVALGPFVAIAQAPSTAIPIEWTVPGSRVSVARSAINFKPDQVRGDSNSAADSKGLPLLYILAGLVLLPELAKGLVSVYKDWINGSTIIDATGHTLAITHDPKGSSDTIIVKSGDGKVVIYDNRKNVDSSKWMEILLEAATKIKK